MTVATGRTDWKRCSAYLTLAVALMEDGTYTALLTSYHGDPRKTERYRLQGGVQQFDLAPAGLSALAEAAQQALDAFWSGDLG